MANRLNREDREQLENLIIEDIISRKITSVEGANTAYDAGLTGAQFGVIRYHARMRELYRWLEEKRAEEYGPGYISRRAPGII